MAMKTVVTKCPFCHVEHRLQVNEKDYAKWEGGEQIQNVFHYLSPSQRELLMTGVCDTCFPDEEED